MLKLRPYKPFDAETILSWLDSERTMRIWSGPRHPHFPPSLEEMQSLYDGYGSQAVNFPMVDYDERGAVGVVTLRFLAPDEKEVRLCNILVDPARRGSGIGRELLAMAVEELREAGISPVYLLTDHTGFYERYGWEFLCTAKADGDDYLSRMYIHR